jgi:sulfur transfer protein SufE
MTKKPGQREPVPVDIPSPPPKLPQEVVDRFPSLAQWEDQWRELWESTRDSIRKRDAEIETRLTKLENP